MKKKKCIEMGFIILVVVGISLLVGKNMRWFSGQTEKEGNYTLLSKEKIIENASKVKYPIDVPYEWQEIIDDNNKIDAVINIPDSIRTEGFLKASSNVTAAKQQGILSLLEDYYQPYQSMEDERVIQYRGEDDLYLYLPKVEDEGISVSCQLRNYISMAYRDNVRTEEYNRDLYLLEDELEGFSIEECDRRIAEICEKVGISGEIDIVHRTLDYQKMEEEASELHMDGSRTKPNYAWKSTDSSYYCTISQLCNKVPIIQTYMLDA